MGSAADPAKARLPDPAVEELKQQMAALRSELDSQKETNRRLSESVQVMSTRLTMLTTTTAQTVRRNELERTIDQIKAHSATLGPPGLKVTVGGQYRVMRDQSNFSWHDATIPEPGATATPTRNAFGNVRLRNNLDVRVDERHGGFLQYEVGHVSLGANAEFPKAAGNPSNPVRESELARESLSQRVGSNDLLGGRFAVDRRQSSALLKPQEGMWPSCQRRTQAPGDEGLCR